VISRAEAVERASAYLREHGSSWFAYADGAQCNPSQGLWIVEPRDPEQQEASRLRVAAFLWCHPLRRSTRSHSSRVPTKS